MSLGEGLHFLAFPPHLKQLTKVQYCPSYIEARQAGSLIYNSQLFLFPKYEHERKTEYQICYLIKTNIKAVDKIASPQVIDKLWEVLHRITERKRHSIVFDVVGKVRRPFNQTCIQPLSNINLLLN